MKQQPPRTLANATNASARKQNVLSSHEVKTRLSEQGKTLKQWAKDHGYPYQTTSQVVRGVNRGTYGLGHRIAVALGLKREQV